MANRRRCRSGRGRGHWGRPRMALAAQPRVRPRRRDPGGRARPGGDDRHRAPVAGGGRAPPPHPPAAPHRPPPPTPPRPPPACGPSGGAGPVGLRLSAAVGAWGRGSPGCPRPRRRAGVAALGATATAAAVISVLQLIVGDALLPRAVVFGSVLVLVPWYVLWARVAGDARSRDAERDRVLLVGDFDEVDTLRAELDRAPERHAVVAAAITPETAALTDPPRLPLVEAAATTRPTGLVLSHRPQSDEDVVLQAARLHEPRIRGRTLSLLYEQWLEKTRAR